MQSYIGDKKPGDVVKLTLFRFDRLRDINFTLGGNMRREYSFDSVDEPTDLHRRLYRDYLNAELK